MCSNHIVDGFYDWGDGTVPSRSGEHARYRNPQAQVIKVPGEHTQMLSGQELHDHLRRILLGSETGASQQGETARSGHVSVAGMLHPQATTFTLPPVASNEQTTFFNTALDTPLATTGDENIGPSVLNFHASSLSVAGPSAGNTPVRSRFTRNTAVSCPCIPHALTSSVASRIQSIAVPLRRYVIDVIRFSPWY